jgi:hypothetical protein
MNVREIQDTLNEIEEKFSVDEWVVEGIHVWPIIRLDLMMAFSYSGLGEEQRKINIVFKLKELYKILIGLPIFFIAYIKDFKKNATLRKSDAIFLTDADTRIKYMGEWFDRVCDPLIDIFQKKEISTFVLEKSSHKYMFPRFGSSFFITPHLDFVLIYGMLFSRKPKVEIEKLKGYSEFLNFLKEKNYSVSLPDEKRLSTILFIIQLFEEYFKKILLQIKPSVGFVVSYYNPICMAFNLACYRLSVPSIDIQHGMQGEYHGAYAGWMKTPKKGYELLPSYFWCWSKNEEKTIRKWSKKIPSHKPIVGGNFYLQQWRAKSDGVVKFYDEQMKKLVHKSNILVTLSPIEEDNIILLEKLFKVTKKFSSEYKWWIRVHPTMLQRRKEIKYLIQKHAVKNCEVDLATEFPLYALLRFMQVHITSLSSSVLEAKEFGVYSLIVSENGALIYHDQIKKGYGVAVYSDREIIQGIRNIKSKKFSGALNDKIRQKDGFQFIDSLLKK